MKLFIFDLFVHANHWKCGPSNKTTLSIIQIFSHQVTKRGQLYQYHELLKELNLCKCHPLVDLANAVLLYELLKFQDNLDMVSQKVSSLLEIRAEVSGLCV